MFPFPVRKVFNYCIIKYTLPLSVSFLFGTAIIIGIQGTYLSIIMPVYDKLGFSTTGSENLQMYKQGFQEAEEPQIKTPASMDYGESKGVPEKYLLLLH